MVLLRYVHGETLWVVFVLSAALELVVLGGQGEVVVEELAELDERVREFAAPALELRREWSLIEREIYGLIMFIVCAYTVLNDSLRKIYVEYLYIHCTVRRVEEEIETLLNFCFMENIH